MSNTLKVTYNFKTLLASALAVLLSDYEPEGQEYIKSQFDMAEDGSKGKRKPVEVELTMPAFYDSLPSDLAKRAIASVVQDFVKATYIDNFQEVGQHDWDYIEKELAAARTRGGISIAVTEDQWNLAASTIAAFVSATGLNPKLTPALEGIVKGKFSAGAIRRSLGRDDVDTLSKLETRFTEWATWIGENDAENADDCATVYGAIGKKLDKMLKREDVAPLADIL